MARLFTHDGDEICWLARLVIEGVNFTAEVARYVVVRRTIGEAILQTDGAHYRVMVDSWDVGAAGAEVERLRGRIAAKI